MPENRIVDKMWERKILICLSALILYYLILSQKDIKETQNFLNKSNSIQSFTIELDKRPSQKG